ncbi:MAG: hypothetical protein AAB734_01585 [Patescibacteria group bacterium]
MTFVWCLRGSCAILLTSISWAFIKIGLQGFGIIKGIEPEPLNPTGFAARYPFGMIALGLGILGLALLCITPPRLAPIWKWRYYESAAAIVFTGALGFGAAALLYDMNAQVVLR